MLQSLRRALRPTWWELQRTLWPRGRRVVLNGAVAIRVDPAVNVGHGYHFQYETRFFRQFLRSIPSGGVVYDVGANQGLYSISAGKRVRPDGRVYAFEPAPAALSILTRQIALNKMTEIITPVATLVGETDEAAVPFFAAETAVGWASAAYQPPGTRRLHVPVQRLDSFVVNNPPPHVIKIDVEGFEWEVLSGACDLLRGYNPKVFCALHPEILETRGRSVLDILSLMRQHGYDAADLRGRPLTSETREAVFSKL